MALSCCVPPTESEAFCGFIAIEAIGGATESVVLAVVLSRVAVIVAVPVATAVAAPIPLMDAIDGESELQVTNAVKSSVPPPL